MHAPLPCGVVAVPESRKQRRLQRKQGDERRCERDGLSGGMDGVAKLSVAHDACYRRTKAEKGVGGHGKDKVAWVCGRGSVAEHGERHCTDCGRKRQEEKTNGAIGLKRTKRIWRAVSDAAQQQKPHCAKRCVVKRQSAEPPGTETKRCGCFQ